MNKIATYKNGNVMTTIYSDGTKVHYTADDDFRFAFPESHDISISQCCDNGCKWCYYGCTRDGKHGKLLGWKFFDSMRPYTEIAINLQSPLPNDLMPFLEEMKKRKIIVNATINQNHFMNDNIQEFLYRLVQSGYITGVGVSLTDSHQEGFIDTLKMYKNAVVHVIAGITPIKDIMTLANNDLKLLILGYKAVGRGSEYFDDNIFYVFNRIKNIKRNLDYILTNFRVVSFDNLAIDQLGIKDRLSDEEWERFYGGDDGTLTFFIDLVKGVFARNSLSQITYPIGDKTIDEMFDVIRSEINE